MSHITKIKTKLVDRDYLLKTLDSLDISYRIGPEKITSFYGEERIVDIVLPTSNPKYPIGLSLEDGSYQLVADWYGIKDTTPDAILQKITQQYSYLVVTEKLYAQGFEISEQTTDEENQIRITLRR